MTNNQTVAVIGTGGIGASWAVWFLAQGLTVHAHDPHPEGAQLLRARIDQFWEAASHAAGAGAVDPFARLHWATDVAQAVTSAEFVQENGPEALELKRSLFAQIAEAAPADAILATSSSSLLISDIQAAVRHPERVVLGHPFSPPHLVPLVEVAGGTLTSEAAIERAIAFYRAIGKSPVRLNREITGHIANRLQVAVWREAFHLIASGLATAEDIDLALTDGPGMRWAALGPCAVMHVAGGSGGIGATLHHMVPAMNAIAADLYSGDFTPEIVDAVVASTETAAAGRTPEQLAAARDAALLRILAAKR